MPDLFRSVVNGPPRSRSAGGSDRGRATTAGYPAEEFAAHSLRAGFLTSAAASSASTWKMREVSRHKPMQVLLTGPHRVVRAEC